MKKKVIFSAALVSASIITAYAFMANDHSAIEPSNVVNTNSTQSGIENGLSDHGQPSKKSTKVISEEGNMVIAQAETQTKLKSYDDDWCFASELTETANKRVSEEYYKWSASRNHNVGDRKELVNTYKEYNINALKILGEQGDLVALAAIVLNSKNSTELQDWASRTAGIYGGTGDALQHIPSSRKARAISLMLRGMKDEAKNTFLEGMAWDEFMVMRGDTTLLEITPFMLSLDSLKDLKINKDDQEWVTQRAKEIYSELTKERKNLGLDEFDNFVPRSVQIENLASAVYAKEKYGASDHHMNYFPDTGCLEKRLELMAIE